MSLWHLSRQYLSLQHLPIQEIYQLLLTWFWPNFKVLYTIFYRCQLSWDICPCNIHALATFVHISNISVTVTDLILTDLFWPNFLGAFIAFILDQSSLDPDIFWTQGFSDPKSIRAQNLLDHNFIGPKKNLNKIFGCTQKHFLTFFSDTKFFRPKIFFFKNLFWTQICSDPNFFWIKFFYPKIFADQ